MDLSEAAINTLIREVGKNGKLTLDLAQIVREALEKIQLERPADSSGGGGDDEELLMDDNIVFEPLDDDEAGIEIEIEQVEVASDGETPEVKRKKTKVSISADEPSDGSSDAEEEQYRGPEYGIQGWGRAPVPRFDKRGITREREREIRQNPLEFIEFVYQNRRFKLKPIGTIEPVPKRIYFGRNGAPYYYKTRGPHGEKLNIGDWTKIYLKDYQKKQCFRGRSDRSVGLAGYVDVNGECLNRPPGGRTEAARPSKTRQ